MRHNRARPNLLGKQGRLHGRLDVELFRKETPAALVLDDGCLALPAQRQEQHQLPVGVLVPRLERQQATRIVDTVRVRSALDRVCHEQVQGVDRALPQPLPQSG